jgi:Tol biopolymer transport system component
VLWAQRFDATTLEVSGEAFPVSDEVALLPGVFPGAAYAASANGVLAWRSGSGLAAMQLTWFDRSGRKLGTVGEPADYSNPALSPDERSLAVGRLDPQRKSRDLWIFDLMRGTSTRLTFDPAEEFNPTWSPDGTRVAFTSDRRGVREIYQKPANGSGDDALLVESTDWPKHVEDWSPDGKYLLYNYSRGGLPSDLFLWPLLPGADRNPIPFVTTAFVEREGRFAPQGGWVAYCSNESGRIEVYVRRASPDGASGQEKWRVSTAGGITPQWRRDGKELFYVSGSTLMAVDVKADGASFEAGMPRPLFEVRLSTEPRRNHFVVSRDGQRFLVNTVIDQAGQVNEPIQVLLNWLPSNR